MPEKISPETRSKMMASIHSRDTTPELLVRHHLHAKGFRYRVSPAGLPGRPDVVMPKWKVAVFVHGCFWHGHESCRYFRLPATRREFWVKKIVSNKSRDRAVTEQLLRDGWRVVEVWECALRDAPEVTLRKVVRFVKDGPAHISLESPQANSA